jgi:pimeloyl-ACP methyl ester carboxylesterase
VRGDLARLRDVFSAQAQAMAQPLTDEQVEALLAGQRAVAERDGLDAESWLAATRRGLITRDGKTYLRPGAEVTSALREAPEFVDGLPVFAGVGCPMLIVTATRDIPELPAEFGPLMGAFRAGLRRDLAALCAAVPTVVVREIDASHGMVFEQPERIAALVTEFVGDRAGATAEGSRLSS